MSDKKSQGVEPDLVRELAAILRDTDLTEIEVEHGELKLRLARNIMMAPQATVTYAQAPAAAPAAAAAPTTPAAPASPAAHPGVVLSPMVGTVYLQENEGAAPFVKVGDTVTVGQTVLIVEAMKTFNKIPAPHAGKVKELLVGNKTEVEYNQPLLIIE